MAKLYKSGRVVVILGGKYAGKKAIVLSSNESGTKNNPFSHIFVVGIKKAPLKVHKRLSKKKIERRIRTKVFFKLLNQNHVMPTRYSVHADFDLKSILKEYTERESKKEAKQEMEKYLLEKFMTVNTDKTGKSSRDINFIQTKLMF